jgi:hypothetical protein
VKKSKKTGLGQSSGGKIKGFRYKKKGLTSREGDEKK